MLEPRGGAREEQEEPTRPRSDHGRRTAHRRRTPTQLTQDLGYRERQEERPRHRARRKCPPEENERIAVRVPWKLAIQKEENVLIHDVVPGEPGVEGSDKRVPGDDHRRDDQEPEHRP